MDRNSRIERARGRAGTAKRAIGLLTAVVFGVAFVGAKTHATSQTKGTAKPSAQASVERKVRVRHNVTQGGQIAPAVQPPPVGSSTS